MVIFKEKTICDNCLKEIFTRDAFKIHLVNPTVKKIYPFVGNTFNEKPITVCRPCRDSFRGRFKYADQTKRR